MTLGRLPVELADQMAVDEGGGDADVVQHPQLEQAGLLALNGPQSLATLGGHDADPLAVCHIADADQIQRRRQGVYQLAQINLLGNQPAAAGMRAVVVHDALPPLPR